MELKRDLILIIQCSIVFNNTCLNKNLMLKYTLFNVYCHENSATSDQGKLSQRFSNKPKMKTTRNTQFIIQIIINQKNIKACMRSKTVLATKMKTFIF